MKRIIFSASLLSVISGFSLTVGAQDDAPPALNYMGENIALSVFTPPIIGREYKSIPAPIIQSETTLKSHSAVHIITLDDIGVVKVKESIAINDQCTNLPLDRIDVSICSENKNAQANFCLSSVRENEKILINISYSVLGTGSIQDIETMVLAVAACGTKTYHDIYVNGDTFIGRSIFPHNKM